MKLNDHIQLYICSQCGNRMHLKPKGSDVITYSVICSNCSYIYTVKNESKKIPENSFIPGIN